MADINNIKVISVPLTEEFHLPVEKVRTIKLSKSLHWINDKRISYINYVMYAIIRLPYNVLNVSQHSCDTGFIYIRRSEICHGIVSLHSSLNIIGKAQVWGADLVVLGNVSVDQVVFKLIVVFNELSSSLTPTH